jgi:hypothetical protein
MPVEGQPLPDVPGQHAVLPLELLHVIVVMKGNDVGELNAREA